jgi:hypothetical protein
VIVIWLVVWALAGAPNVHGWWVATLILAAYVSVAGSSRGGSK